MKDISRQITRYESEEGYIKIPLKEWPRFKKELREAYNDYQEYRLTMSKRIYDDLIKEAKGKRGFNYKENIELSKVIFPIDIKLNAKGKPLKPKKKNFPLALKTKTLFNFRNATIGLNNQERVFAWIVEEGDCAVRIARNSLFGNEVFKILNRVNWTPQSGGVIYYSYEHFEEDAVISNAYGGVGKKIRGY